MAVVPILGNIVPNLGMVKRCAENVRVIRLLARVTAGITVTTHLFLKRLLIVRAHVLARADEFAGLQQELLLQGLCAQPIELSYEINP